MCDHQHIKVIGVLLKREHCKYFLAYTGAGLMFVDFSWAAAGPHIFPHAYEHWELFIANSGKCGAAMSGIAVFFERMIRSA